MEQKNTTLSDIYFWKKFVEKNQSNGLLTESGMATLLRNRKKNGLQESGAVVLINNKTFIVEHLFLEWVLNKTE